MRIERTLSLVQLFLGNGELYAMVTNTPANGIGGIVYKLIAVLEPTSTTSALLAISLLAAVRRRY
jgi:hypothetical protein